MIKRAKSVFEVLKQTYLEFMQDDCPRLAAAMAYYTVFSLPPLLFLVIMIAGFAYPGGEAQEALTAEMTAVVGQESAQQISTMVESARERAYGQGGLLMTIVGGVVFVFGATGAFAQLQAALNRAWQVAPDPERAGIKTFIFKRLLSFGMILGTGFLLLVSLVLSALVSALGSEIAAYLPSTIGSWVPRALDFAVSLIMITLLFAAIYKILPDAEIHWREVWVGAFATAVLFVIGKFGIGIYLGQSNPGSAYGAAGSLAIVLFWIYLSTLILLLGAEFTQVWARRYGKRIRPSQGAVRMVWTKEGEVRRDDDTAESPA